MTVFGKANYEAYREFSYGKSMVTGQPIPEWGKLPVHIQSAWDAGADGVALVLAECPVDEDAPGSEPKPATVIVVVEPRGEGSTVERRYAADEIDDRSDYAHLRIKRDGRHIATYNADAWLSVREDGATVPDATKRALGIAKRALNEIVRRSEDYDQPFERAEIGAVVSTALNDIWNETEA